MYDFWRRRYGPKHVKAAPVADNGGGDTQRLRSEPRVRFQVTQESQLPHPASLAVPRCVVTCFMSEVCQTA
jgi:hypothetical protein